MLFVVLFVYAAVSKLLDFEIFRTQLAQSPFLSPFTKLLSWVVVIAELLIACLLCIRKTRLLALYMSLFLMILFTIYIAIILNFAANVPCSCGGVLEALGWKEHLIFNGSFIGIALIGILIERNRKHDF